MYNSVTEKVGIAFPRSTGYEVVADRNTVVIYENHHKSKLYNKTSLIHIIMYVRKLYLKYDNYKNAFEYLFSIFKSITAYN